MRYLLADSGELMLVENTGLESMSSFARPVVREANDEVSLLVVAPFLAGGVWVAGDPLLLIGM